MSAVMEGTKERIQWTSLPLSCNCSTSINGGKSYAHQNIFGISSQEISDTRLL